MRTTTPFERSAEAPPAPRDAVGLVATAAAGAEPEFEVAGAAPTPPPSAQPFTSIAATEATTWSIDGTRFATTVTTANGWWVLGADVTADEIVVMTGDSPAADQHSARIDDQGLAFVARLPDFSSSATVFANADDYPARQGADPRSFDWYTDVFQPAL